MILNGVLFLVVVIIVVLAEDIPVVRGQYGEHQGNAAVKVDEIVEIFDPDQNGIKLPQH